MHTPPGIAQPAEVQSLWRRIWGVDPEVVAAGGAEHAIGVLPARADRRPKIVFVNRFFYPDMSATSQMLYDLSHRLVQGGFDVHVVCSRQLYSDPTASLATTDVIHGVKVHRIWTCTFGRGRLLGRACDYMSFYLSAAVALMRVVRRDDILVAKTDPPLISIVAAIVAKVKGGRLINWLQDVFPEVASYLDANPLPVWLDRHLQQWRDASLKAAKQNIVLGTRMQRHLTERGIGLDRLRIIENWADGVAIAPQNSDSTLLRKLNGLCGKFVVAYSGNLGRAHEYETILQAARALHAVSEIVFLMIGNGAKWGALRREVEQCKLTNFVFLPYQPRESLADSLCAADVHLVSLLPALEGLIVPSKYYGILAAGRPVIFIGDPDGELARKIGDADCGAVVGVSCGGELATIIQSLRAQPKQVQALGERARQVFEREHTLAHAADKWRRVIESV